jgi:hypothetical protein
MATNSRADHKYCAILLFLLSISGAVAQTAASSEGSATRELKRLVFGSGRARGLDVANCNIKVEARWSAQTAAGLH